MFENYLWTPWRMEYIGGTTGNDKPIPQTVEEDNTPPDKAAQDKEQAEKTGCVFCDKLNISARQDRENLVLLRGERNFIILNLFPYNTAHLMVVPYEHTSDYASLDEQTTSEMTSFLQRMIRVIQAEYKPEGFNMGMNIGRVSGAGIAEHVHAHLVPRWAGDSNFMPIVGATKVMPELLETTYDRLRARMASVN